MHELLHLLGGDSVSSNYYAMWSGFLGDITIVGAIGGLYIKHNCSVKRCWRISKVRLGDHMVCHKHHPVGALQSSSITKE
jgi:hypothetical protein